LENRCFQRISCSIYGRPLEDSITIILVFLNGTAEVKNSGPPLKRALKGTNQLLFRWRIPPVATRGVPRGGRPVTAGARMARRAPTTATFPAGRSGGARRTRFWHRKHLLSGIIPRRERKTNLSTTGSY
jgi:hypothetical protein